MSALPVRARSHRAGHCIVSRCRGGRKLVNPLPRALEPLRCGGADCGYAMASTLLYGLL